MERATGIEPALSVWKTETLPLSYARTRAPASQPSVQHPGYRLTPTAARRGGPVAGSPPHRLVLAGSMAPVHWCPVSARGVAQLGSALALGARGRGFESRHPDRVGPYPRPSTSHARSSS